MRRGGGPRDPAFQPHAYVFGDDDPVIDQQAQCDDHGRDGHALKLDLEYPHDDDPEQHGQGHEGSDDQPGAQTEKHHHNRQHDAQRLINVGDRALHRGLDQVGLKGGVIQHVTDGQFLFDLVQQGGQILPEGDVVGAFDGGDGEDDGGPVVEERREFGRVDVIPADRDDLLQAQGAVRVGDLEGDGADILDRREVAAGFQDDRAAARIDLSARFDDVLRGQRAEDLLRRDAQLSDAGRIHLQIDALFLNAQQVNLPHPLQGIEQVSGIAGDVAHFGHRKPVGPQGDGRDRGEPLFVVDERSLRALRQVRLHIVRLVADILEHRVQIVDLFPDLQGEFHRTRLGGRLDLIDLGDLPHRRFQGHRDKLLDPLRGHAGKGGGDACRPDLDRRILGAWIVEICRQADRDDRQNAKDGDARVVERQLSEVHSGHSPSSFTV